MSIIYSVYHSAIRYNIKFVLYRWFQIVRILPAAQPNSQLIVGITYEYSIEHEDPFSEENNQQVKKENKTEQISQQIFVGKVDGSGKPIKWVQITSRRDQNVVNEEITLKEKRMYYLNGFLFRIYLLLLRSLKHFFVCV